MTVDHTGELPQPCQRPAQPSRSAPSRCARWTRLALSLPCLLAPITACAENTASIRAVISDVRSQMRPLQDSAAAELTPSEDAFQRHYGLPVAGCERRAGYVQGDGARIFVQTFRPPQPKGSVLVVHGYYDHAGVLSALIRMLVANNYAVMVYDQPGHGVSDGDRADIDTFARYATVLKVAVARVATDLPGPYHLVAHSLGCSAVLDYLVAEPTVPFAHVVFVAPLIRSAAWHASKLGNAIAGAVVDSLPRTFRRNSADRTFCASVKADPLQPRRVPLHWVRALKTWNERVAAFKPTSHRVWVLQGTHDTTVDWKFNLPRLRALFPQGCTVSLWPGGGHQLLNEAEPMRSQVLRTIREILADAYTPMPK